MLCDIVYPCVSFAPGDVSNKASALIVVGFVVVALYLSWLYVEWDSARSRHRQLRRRATACVCSVSSPEPLSEIPPGLICDDKVTQRLFAVRPGED